MTVTYHDSQLETLERLAGLRPGPKPAVTLVAAHPDDETIGAGAGLHEIHRLEIVHVTDGSPLNLEDAQAAGFYTHHDYAEARRQEVHAAMQAGGIGSYDRVSLGFIDQEASLNLVEITRALLRDIWQFQPDAVMTHPYEGGHPDHDACAFAVAQAAHIMDRVHLSKPVQIEMTSYHGAKGYLVTGEFLHCAEREEIAIQLGPEDHRRKKRMFECFNTQNAVLSLFRCDQERFRIAPEYDFTKPPHTGLLYYERLPWGMTGKRWRELAKEAMEELAA